MGSIIHPNTFHFFVSMDIHAFINSTPDLFPHSPSLLTFGRTPLAHLQVIWIYFKARCHFYILLCLSVRFDAWHLGLLLGALGTIVIFDIQNGLLPMICRFCWGLEWLLVCWLVGWYRRLAFLAGASSRLFIHHNKSETLYSRQTGR